MHGTLRGLGLILLATTVLGASACPHRARREPEETEGARPASSRDAALAAATRTSSSAPARPLNIPPSRTADDEVPPWQRDRPPPGFTLPVSLDLRPGDRYQVDGKTRLPRHNERSSLGTNLTFMKDYSGEYTFVDAFKQSRPWFSGSGKGGVNSAGWDDRRPLDLDDRGWVRSLDPGQVARALFFWYDRKIQYPEGPYVVLYDGEGTLDFGNARVTERQPGRVVIEPDPKNGGFGLFITETSPANYLRNIRVLMPGGVCKNEPYKACRAAGDCAEKECIAFERVHEQQIFHPTFLDRLKTYATIRYKDWMDVDHSRQKEWDDRPKLTDAQWTRRGVPIEIIVELSNRLQVDTWVNVPHLASDGYAAALATYVGRHLDPARKIFVEHSNEVWNGVFGQARWLAKRAEQEKVGRDTYQGQLILHARRSKAIFRIFEKALGGRQRLVRVLATHPGNPWSTEQLLELEDTWREVDALAVTGYFGHRLGQPANAERVKALSIDAFMDEIDKDAKETMTLIARHIAIAKKRNLAIVAYEGGEHLVAVGEAQNDRALDEKLDQASHHPRMKAIYLDHLARWRAAGGGLFLHFVNCTVDTRFGRFGALTSLDQPRKDAPKFDALQEFIEKTPRWW